MNFILNNKLATFLIFLILYCLFNYQLNTMVEGFDPDGRYIKNRATGKVRIASSKEIANADSTVANAMEAREVSEAATKEVARDREIALDAKTPTQQKEATETGALARKVDAIDGDAGQEAEKAAAAEMSALLDRPRAETGARGDALGGGSKMAQAAAAAAAKLSKMAMASTMKDVKRAQDIAIENLQGSVSSSKGIEKKLANVSANYGLADQGEGFGGVTGAGSEVSGSAKNNSKELIKQRDRVAGQLPCKERCEYLYDNQTGYICDSGNCICKVKKDNINFSNLPGEASAEGGAEEPPPTKSDAPKFAKEKALHEGAVCVGYADNKVLLKEWYGAQKWTPSACKAKCKETEGCKFYSSRLNDNGACMLFSNCPKQRSDGGYKGYNVYAVGDTEGFRSGFSDSEKNESKYIYRIHGKCDAEEMSAGEA
jgi:hypothetical protein